MSTIPSPLSQQATPQRPSLKAPVILFLALLVAGDLSLRWLHSRSQSSTPVFHQTNNGWQQLPSPGGKPEKLRVTPNGTVWILTWGRTALSRWDGSKWHYYKATDFGAKTTFNDGNFALDGEKVWAPTEQGVLHWDGQTWHCDKDVLTSRGASIVAFGGQVWIVDQNGKSAHFKDGHWESRMLSLPGMRFESQRPAAKPELARTSDGTVWLVWQRLWRLYGDIWLPVIADGKVLDEVTMIGAAGDRLWLSDAAGLRTITADGHDQAVYPAAQTGIPDEVEASDVATNGRLTWFSTGIGIYEFDGSNWRLLPRPNQKVPGIHALAAAPDGTLWAIGFTPGGIFRDIPYVPFLLILMPLGIGGASIWFFRRARARQLQQHQRVAQAVQHVTGEVPIELEIGQRQLASSGWVWIVYLFGSGLSYFIIRQFWPQEPYWMLAVLAVAIHVLITFQQSLVKRKPKEYDPIGPGAPSQYDWGKTLKSVAGAALFILILNADRFPALGFLRGYTFWAGFAVVIGYKAYVIRLVNQALRRGDYDGALKIIRWMHFYNPSGSEAMRMSGHILLAAGRYREAEDAIRRSFTNSTAGQTYGMALEYLGDTLMEQGRYDEAQRSFEAALHTFPWLRRPYRGLAEMQLRRGKDPQQALDYIERIIDFEGLSLSQRKSNGRPQDDYWALKAWALAALGRSSEVQPAIDNALKATSQACRPDLATTHYRAGLAMQALGNISAANQHFQKAIEYDPHGRRGMLANAAMHASSVWGAVRV